MHAPGINPSLQTSISSLVQQIETKSKTTYNGHSIGLPNSASRKASEVAQDNLSNITQTPERMGIAHRATIATPQEFNKVQDIWVKISDQPKPPQNESFDLQLQLNTFKACLSQLQYQKHSKLVLKEVANEKTNEKMVFFDVAKRGIGVTSGRSEETNQFFNVLNEMAKNVKESDNPELLAQYLGALKDLQDTSWMTKMSSNNPAIKRNLEGLINSTMQALDTNVKSFDPSKLNRKELRNAVNVLSKAANTNKLPQELKTSFDTAIKNANIVLNKTDPETFKNHLLGKDPHTAGRTLLLDAAGWTVKGHEYIAPISFAMQEAYQIQNPQERAEAFSSIADFAIKLSTLSKEQLDEPYKGDNENLQNVTLRDTLKGIQVRLSGMSDEEIAPKAKALVFLLSQPSPSIDNFRNALTEGNDHKSFMEAAKLTFLSQSELRQPLNPQDPFSPSIYETMLSVRQKAGSEERYVESGFPEMFDILLSANAEKVDSQPYTIPAGNTSMEQVSQIVRNGDAEREKLLQDLTSDMRHTFASMVKQMRRDEFINQKWMKSGKKEAPNILRSIQVFNDTKSTIVTAILNPKKAQGEETAKSLEKQKQEFVNSFVFYVDLLETCLEDKNYYAGMAILSSLTDPSIDRITKFPNSIPQATREKLNKASTLLDPASHFGNYKKALNESGEKPAIPFLSEILNDLTLSEDGNPNELEGKFNLDKMNLINKTITTFIPFRNALDFNTKQETNFFTSTPKLEEFDNPKQSKNLESLNFERSLQLYPRKTKKSNRFSNLVQRAIRKSK